MGSSIKGVHTQRDWGLCQKWTNVDLGEGVATADVHKLYHSFVTVYSCLTLTLPFQETAQKWAKVTPFYVIVNLIPHSNFKVYMFYLLIYV